MIYRHFTVNSEQSHDFQVQIEGVLNKERPDPSQVMGVLSNGRDFHIWYIPGNSAAKYSMETIVPSQKGVGWADDIADKLGDEKMIFLGFNRGDDSTLWYLSVS